MFIGGTNTNSYLVLTIYSYSMFLKNGLVPENVSRRCSRERLNLFSYIEERKDYTMTLNIISPFPYLNYVPQILPFEAPSEYLFNRVNTNLLSLALWLN